MPTRSGTYPRTAIDRLFFGKPSQAADHAQPSPPPTESLSPTSKALALCPAEKPLGGWVEWTYSDAGYARCPFVETIRLDFRLETASHWRQVLSRGQKQGDMVRGFVQDPLPFVAGRRADGKEAKVVRYSVKQGPFTGPNNDGVVCTGIGATAHSESGRTERLADVWFNPWIPRLAASLLDTGTRRPYVEQFPSGTQVRHQRWVPTDGASNPLDIIPSADDRPEPDGGSIRVPPGSCWTGGRGPAHVPGVPSRSCLEDPRGHAMLPFEGSGRAKPDRLGNWTKARWKICCGCGGGRLVKDDKGQDCPAELEALTEYWDLELKVRLANFWNAMQNHGHPDRHDLPLPDETRGDPRYDAYWAAHDSYWEGEKERDAALEKARLKCAS